VDGVFLDSIESANVADLCLKRFALKAWDEQRFAPMLEVLGMN
jgi:hypothetical protein